MKLFNALVHAADSVLFACSFTAAVWLMTHGSWQEANTCLLLCVVTLLHDRKAPR